MYLYIFYFIFSISLSLSLCFCFFIDLFYLIYFWFPSGYFENEPAIFYFDLIRIVIIVYLFSLSFPIQTPCPNPL